MRGGKGNDLFTTIGSVAGGYINGDLGADSIVLGGNVAEGTSIQGGGVTSTTTDGNDNLYFYGTVDGSHVQGNGGNDTIDLLVQ